MGNEGVGRRGGDNKVEKLSKVIWSETLKTQNVIEEKRNSKKAYWKLEAKMRLIQYFLLFIQFKFPNTFPVKRFVQYFEICLIDNLHKCRGITF
jgi:hypothetical protein